MLDNSLSIGRGNLAICRETIRYLAENAGEDTDLALAVFGEDIGILTDFGESREVLKERLDTVELMDRDTYIIDNLTELLLSWKKADLADRCIVLFTDGEEKEPLYHDKEELYFLLARLDYPVYVVDCVTKRDVPIKTLSAISTISGGELLYTEFEDSEAGVEQKLGDKILALSEAAFSYREEAYATEPAIDSYEEVLEAEDDRDTFAQGEVQELMQADDAADTQETVAVSAYENPEHLAANELAWEGGVIERKPGNYLTILGMVCFAIIFLTVIRLIAGSRPGRKKKRRRKSRAPSRRSAYRSAVRTESFEEPTLCLKDEDRSSGDTMLLFQAEGGQTV